MARKIDFTKPLSDDDLAYVADRPWIMQDLELSGVKIPDGTEPEDTEDEDDEEEVDYNDFSVEELKAEIATRNEEREEADEIKVAGKGNKADLIAALSADDEAEEE